MKTKSKEELKQIAFAIFEKYPKANNVACTSDGMAFITDCGSSNVKNHAAKNKYGKTLTITEFTRDEMNESEPPASSKTVISEIESAKDVSAVEAILNSEKSGANRKGVIKAGETKINFLKAEISLTEDLAKVEALTTQEELDEFLAKENSGEKRVAVIEATENKIKSLKSAE